jgi:hypothetical protein
MLRSMNEQTELQWQRAVSPVGVIAAGFTSALTFWRYRQTVWPLILTIAATVLVYVAVFASRSHGAMHDTMADSRPALVHHHTLSSGRRALAGVGLGVLIAAQLWDLMRVRMRREPRPVPALKAS